MDINLEMINNCTPTKIINIAKLSTIVILRVYGLISKFTISITPIFFCSTTATHCDHLIYFG